MKGKGWDTIDAQLATRSLPSLRYLRIGVVNRSENIARPQVICLSFGCEGHAARGSMQQANPKPVLQTRDQLANCRRRYAKVLRGCREAAALNDADKRAQIANRSGSTISDGAMSGISA